MQVDNRRKVMVASFTFKELGQAAMFNGDMWLTPVAVRSSKMREVRGGWSALLTRFLRRLLLGPTGFSSAGVPIELPTGIAVVFAKVSNLLTDGDGFRVAYDWKGHSSTKPCFKHWSLAAHTHRHIDRISDGCGHVCMLSYRSVWVGPCILEKVRFVSGFRCIGLQRLCRS